LARFEYALRLSEIGQCCDLFATHTFDLFTTRDQTRDAFRHRDDRPGAPDCRDENARHRKGELAPVQTPKRLRYDLRKDQDHLCQDGADEPDRGSAVTMRSLSTRTCGTRRMRDRVEPEDRGQRPVDVCFELVQPRGSLTPRSRL